MKRILSCEFLFLTLLIPCLAAAQTYTVTDLGVLATGGYSIGTAINASGEVAGQAGPTPEHGFTWTASQGIKGLSPLKGSFFSFATGINTSGVVAGQSGINVGGKKLYHGVIWTSGKLQDIGVLMANGQSNANAINDSGQVVGSANPSTFNHAILWTKTAGLQDIGTLPGGKSSGAFAINKTGQVVGFSTDSSGIEQGFVWTKSGGMVALASLSGSTSTSAVSINNLGQIVGSSSNSSGNLHPVLWSPSGQIQDLGLLSGTSGYASGINNLGQVVGGESTGAFIWTSTAGMQDLNNLILANSGWYLAGATAINDSGQITGQGTIGGAGHAFLLTPVSN